MCLRGRTTGNPSTHLILRGGNRTGPNYEAKDIEPILEQLAAVDLPQKLIVDCSHGNSGKDPERQPAVLANVLGQIGDGNRHIHSVMLESNLNAGAQKFPVPVGDLKYGVSITDGCMDWSTTETALRAAHASLAGRFE